MASRIDTIMSAQKGVLERLSLRGAREPEFDPYEPQPFQYTEEQKKEIARFGHTLLCRECQNPVAWWDVDSGARTCAYCGSEDARVLSDACEKRFFADEEKTARDAKKRNEEYMDEENMHLSKIQAREIARGCTQEDMWAANNRLNQCVVWLQMLARDESQGGFRLTAGEVRTSRILLRAVCVQWAREGFVGDNFGNPVLWSIGVALQMVALRPEGFAMPTERLCKRATLQGLHDWLWRYRSDAVFMAYESTLAMTRVSGAEARLGQLAAERRVKRHAVFHELGNTPHKRYEKMLVLHKLIVNAGVWDGAGLADPVLKLHSPTLMVRPTMRVWTVRRRVVGVDGDAAKAHRSDTDTDAESAYEDDSTPASPQRGLRDHDTDADDERSKADDGGGGSQRPPLEPAPMALVEPLAHVALAAGLGGGSSGGHEEEDRDSNATIQYGLPSDDVDEGHAAPVEVGVTAGEVRAVRVKLAGNRTREVPLLPAGTRPRLGPSTASAAASSSGCNRRRVSV